MSSLYDQIREVYEALSGNDVNKAREIMKMLVRRGVDKAFLRATFRTIAIEKMAEYLHDEVMGKTSK